MKCDKLKEYKAYEYGTSYVYDIGEVKEAIAELKDKCQMHDFFWEGCGFAKRGFKNAIAVSNAYDDLEAENAKLKAEIESLKASHYAENVDAGMRERRLRRALWLAREWRAWCEGQFWLAIPSNRPRDIYHLFMTNRIHRAPAEWMAYWHKVEQLCNKKAEEYK